MMSFKDFCAACIYYVLIMESVICGSLFCNEGYKCPCCNNKVKFFLPYGTKRQRVNAMCPKCGAMERDRLQRVFFQNLTELESKSGKILHVAPEQAQYNYLKQRFGVGYISADIDANAPNVMKQEDLRSLSFCDECFDIVICNQVLEHIPTNVDDAIRQIARVLKPDGFVIITVPIDLKSETLEDPSIKTDSDRIRYYGEANHYRMFGKDFSERLFSNGLKSVQVRAMDLMTASEYKRIGLSKREFFWKCKKK